MTKLLGYFNPQFEGDDFTGLNGSITGTVADRVISNLPEFLIAAGRNYHIKKAPAYILDPFGGIDTDGQIVESFRQAENQYHLVRSVDHKIVSPHTVTDSYAPLSLMDMSEEIQPWCDAGWATPDGVYDARDGSLELLTLRLDGGEMPIDVPGAKFMHYIVFQNPHGAGGTAKGKIISFRIVCANTFAAAVSASSDFAITHRIAAGDHDMQREIMVARTQKAIAAWDQVKTHISKLSERINTWADIKLTQKDAEYLSGRLAGISDIEKASGRARNRRDAVLDAFNMPNVGTYGATGFDWLNAVTYINSSPLAETNKKSKVTAVDRAVRTLDPNGSGFKWEQTAEKILSTFAGI